MSKKTTYLKLIREKLEQLEVGQLFNIKLFINENWKSGYDYFVRRSFDVNLCIVKKQLKKEFPNKEFKTVKGEIIRTK